MYCPIANHTCCGGWCQYWWWGRHARPQHRGRGGNGWYIPTPTLPSGIPDPPVCLPPPSGILASLVYPPLWYTCPPLVYLPTYWNMFIIPSKSLIVLYSLTRRVSVWQIEATIFWMLRTLEWRRTKTTWKQSFNSLIPVSMMPKPINSSKAPSISKRNWPK